MKKRAFFCMLLLAFLLFLISCEQSIPKDYLKYQAYPFTVEAEIKTGDTAYTAQFYLTDAHIGTIRFLAPLSMEGIEFRITENGTQVELQDLALPLPKEMEAIPNWLSFFSLATDEMGEVAITEQNGVLLNVVHFIHDGKPVIVYLNQKNDFPICIEANQNDKQFLIYIKNFTKEEQIS